MSLEDTREAPGAEAAPAPSGPADVLAETVPPAVVGIMFLGDHTRPGLGGVAVLGFTLAVVCAVALARFGETDEQGLTAAQRRVMQSDPYTAS